MGHFFDLPREVRDMIYNLIFSIEGGYVLDFNSNTLKGANNTSIDLAFIFICKRVARDMKGLAFSLNTLHFSTFYSEEHQPTAGRFDLLVHALHEARGCRWDCIYADTLYVPDEIWREISDAYPRFVPYVEIVQRRPWRYLRDPENIGPPGSCGETPSVFRDFIRSALQKPAAYHKQSSDIKQLTEFENSGPDCLHAPLETLTSLNPDPWAIPTLRQLEDMTCRIRRGPAETIAEAWSKNNKWHRINHSKFRYSAAAVSIRFLESLSKDSRSDIREVVLNEDRAAVGFAECHGLGLIPYCQENPHLRIQRRVSLWRTVFQTTTDCERWRVIPLKDGIRPLYQHEISCSGAVWIVEALELQSAGMPPGSFTLIMDGDTTCSHIFQTVVKPDAATQAAVDICMERGYLSPLSWDLRRKDLLNRLYRFEKTGRWYLFEAFPRAIQDIVAGSSIIRCNFELGDAWDVERLAEENKGRTLEDWGYAWVKRNYSPWLDPEPPSPTFWELVSDTFTAVEDVYPRSVQPFSRYLLREH